MSVTPPKNDKTRKEWLASLKDGDEVAWIAEGSDPRQVTVKRGRDAFVGQNCQFTFATGKGKTDNWRSTDGWIVPLDAVRQEVRATEARERLERVKWHPGRSRLPTSKPWRALRLCGPRSLGASRERS